MENLDFLNFCNETLKKESHDPTAFRTSALPMHGAHGGTECYAPPPPPNHFIVYKRRNWLANLRCGFIIYIFCKSDRINFQLKITNRPYSHFVPPSHSRLFWNGQVVSGGGVGVHGRHMQFRGVSTWMQFSNDACAAVVSSLPLPSLCLNPFSTVSLQQVGSLKLWTNWDSDYSDSITSFFAHGILYSNEFHFSRSILLSVVRVILCLSSKKKKYIYNYFTFSLHFLYITHYSLSK